MQHFRFTDLIFKVFLDIRVLAARLVSNESRDINVRYSNCVVQNHLLYTNKIITQAEIILSNNFFITPFGIYIPEWSTG